MGRPRPAFLVLLGLAAAVAAFMLIKGSGEEPLPEAPPTDTAASATTPATTAPAPADPAVTSSDPAATGTTPAPAPGTTEAPAPPASEAPGSGPGGEGFAGDPTQGVTKPVANAIAPIAHAVADDKVTVLFLYEPGAGDDLATRRRVELLKRSIPRGKAVVLSESVARIGHYGPVLGDLGISQAPAIAVVSPRAEARLLEGFIDRRSLDQFIADAL